MFWKEIKKTEYVKVYDGFSVEQNITFSHLPLLDATWQYRYINTYRWLIGRSMPSGDDL